MLATNTMRWAFDTFTFNKSGLVYPVSTPWNMTNAASSPGFIISSNIPDGCDTKVGFIVDGTISKIASNGTLAALATQAYTKDSLLSEGNTVAELQALTNIPGFVGKIITPVVAMSAPTGLSAYQTFKISLKTVSNQDQHVKTEYSPEYDITGCTVYNATLSSTASNGGSVVAEASVYSNGSWADYVSLPSAKGLTGDKIKFRVTYTATTIGTSIAQLNYLNVYVKTNGSVTLGVNADLITKTQEFKTGMMYSRLLIKHAKLIDANVKAYVNFSQTPLSRDNYQIGVATGSSQTITLTDANIDFTSLMLYANTTRINSFDFNTSLNTITFTADAGKTIFASYEYGFEAESWQEMQKGSTQPYSSDQAKESTDFTYSVTGTEKGVSTIRMVLMKPLGSSTDEYLGVGTGIQQMFVLDHWAKPDTITIKQGTQPVNDANWSYDPSNRIVTVIALKDSVVSATYQWSAETPKVLGYVAAWNQ